MIHTENPYQIQKEDTYQLDSEKKRSFISSVSTKYTCTGSCYCDESTQNIDYRSEEDSRRSSSTLFNKGISYIVVATSSILALKLAKSKFQTECVKENKGSCLASSIHTNVDECEEFEESEEILLGEKGKGRLDAWICRGHCMNNRRLRRPEALELQKDFDCEGLERSGIISIFFTPEMRQKSTGILPHARARNKFRSLFLSKYCREKSKTTYTKLRYLLDKARGKKRWFRQKVTVYLCAGYSHGGNPVRCFKMLAD